MLDSDLTALCGIETRVLMPTVKRNIAWFPRDFIFQLWKEEQASLRSQIVTSRSKGQGGGMMTTLEGGAKAMLDKRSGKLDQVTCRRCCFGAQLSANREDIGHGE